MARKLTAGPTPDGSFIERRTDNAYSHAVAVIDRAAISYRPRNPHADEQGYIPNPTHGTWVSYSWHGRPDLAAKSAEKAHSNGYRAVVVPVVE